MPAQPDDLIVQPVDSARRCRRFDSGEPRQSRAPRQAPQLGRRDSSLTREATKYTYHVMCFADLTGRVRVRGRGALSCRVPAFGPASTPPEAFHDPDLGEPAG